MEDQVLGERSWIARVDWWIWWTDVDHLLLPPFCLPPRKRLKDHKTVFPRFLTVRFQQRFRLNRMHSHGIWVAVFANSIGKQNGAHFVPSLKSSQSPQGAMSYLCVHIEKSVEGICFLGADWSSWFGCWENSSRRITGISVCDVFLRVVTDYSCEKRVLQSDFLSAIEAATPSRAEWVPLWSVAMRVSHCLMQGQILGQILFF